MSTVISVENLSKRYRLGLIGGGTLREDVARWLARLRRQPDPTLKIGHEHHARKIGQEFWALQDVSFQVREGEILGIIGRNGAGKSTLLKILSRVTAPTDGCVRVKGRIASLLEVGTGFHPELTGRENVFLNGAILGMTKAEIRRKFDEIVAFSEVEEFIDTPVKRYSSGMYVRLAFAVAAHLEPEILIVDEVLAVGDAAFQKKCLGKMKDVSTHGRTVLFVSHNMAAVSNLCARALLMESGCKVQEGMTEAIIGRYFDTTDGGRGEIAWETPETAPGNAKVRLHAVRVLCEGQVSADVRIDKDVRVVLEYWNLAPGLPLSASIHLLDHMGVVVLATANLHSANLVRDEWFGRPFPAGLFRSQCTVPANFLNEGRYTLRVALCSHVATIELLTDEILAFNVHDAGEMRKEYTGVWIGVVRPKLAWQTEQLQAAT